MPITINAGPMKVRNQNGNFVSVPGITANVIEKPAVEGTNGQVLTTDGNGNYSWATVSGGTGGGGVIMDLNIDANGHLIYTKSDLVNTDFSISNGHLIMEVK